MKKTTSSNKETQKVRPAINPEALENRLISKAYDLVEKRLDEGTASSQETTHFLKLGSMKNRLELERLEEENKLLRAKTEAIQASKDSAELYENAIRAMMGYGSAIISGRVDEDDEDEY